MEKIWLKNYPPGVAAEINADAYSSLVEMMDEACKKYAHFPAFYNNGVTLSFDEFNRYSYHFAAFLQQELQLKKGDRLAIMLPNLLQYPVAMLGALRAGVVVVNANPLYTADELAHQLQDADVTAILVLANFAATVEKALPLLPHLKHIILTQVGDLFPCLKASIVNFVIKYIYKKMPAFHLPQAISFKQALSQGKKLPFISPTLHGNDMAFLQYTGGTTGVMKGAMLSHRNLIANIQQADAWFKGLLKEGSEIIITALPLYHIFSLTANCLVFTRMGGLNVLITNPRNISAMIKDMKKFRFTAITGVNTLFNALLKNPAFTDLDFSGLRLALGGGMPVQQAVAEKWQKVTHVVLLEAYGLTETSPCVTINPTNLQHFNASIGLPVPSTEVTILDNNAHPVPIGEAGELAVKGPQVMSGYWNNLKETEKVFSKDGWLLTGDIANLDEQGFVRILERKKDMILVSGFNVYPKEIEDVIALLPGVREVAVIGVKDESSGEAPKAFVVKDNPTLTTVAILAHCHQHLTHYKIPKEIEFVPDLPKSNVGKILRRVLRERSAIPA